MTEQGDRKNRKVQLGDMVAIISLTVGVSQYQEPSESELSGVII